MPAKTTRKRREVSPLVDMHRMLSRIDVEKDALYASPSIHKHHMSQFQTCADALFGSLPIVAYRGKDMNDISLRTSLDQSTQFLKDKLKATRVWRSHQIVVHSEYNNLARQFSSVAPLLIEAIHDSGLSPFLFNSEIRVVLNPGSYLDPGQRTAFRECSEIIGFHTPLGPDDFAYLGMPLSDLEAELQTDGSCWITLVTRGQTLRTHFSQQFQQLKGPLFFGGNRVKNEWFNQTSGTNTETDMQSGMHYILCKELGDTLQAYYTAQRLSHNMSNHQVCLFTNDENLLCRGILLSIPVCLSSLHGKDNKIIHYHPAMEDIKGHWQTTIQNHVIAHNQRSINQITQVLNRGYYCTLQDRRVFFTRTSEIAAFLEKCIQTIRKYTKRFCDISGSSISLAEYSKLSAIFLASQLFNQTVANQSAHSLFQKPTPTSPLFPKPFGDYLHSFGQRGEGSSESYILEYIQDSKQTDYTQIDPTRLEEHLPITYVLQALYARVQTVYPDRSDVHHRFMAEDINSKLIPFFAWVQNPMWEDDFIARIVDLYEDGTLATLSFQEFEALHASFKRPNLTWDMWFGDEPQVTVDTWIAELEKQEAIVHRVFRERTDMRPWIKARTRKRARLY